ncbi:hypothetical protein [Sphingobium sp. Cam5-1]|uniref:hypothetical protein n=1 Tax=Sphingobium sp. Cam5-1 TaxID=2789327 RepID=UPI0018AD1028|nr:hypothetical protein [Sphingobium sp. Cam5-1]QPI72375.1 hypothetical protein IZV00_10845 [Sphingobium sp. Cam5-1]
MDENEDSGWVKGLPAGWIDGHLAFDRLRRLLLERLNGCDPAPWHDPVNADYWGPHFGQSPDEYTLSEKLSERLISAFQRALSTKRLPASLFNGRSFRELPQSAFGSKSVLRNALFMGPFDLDPFWPDDWQPWSGAGWAIPLPEFEGWLASGDALGVEGLPMTDVANAPDQPKPLAQRLPSGGAHVPLSEAVTWIAFGFALDAERLDRAIQWERLCDGDLQTAQRQIEDASAALLKAGADRQVTFFGRHVESYGDKGQRTEKIDPLALIDYRQVLITGHDHLYYGKGMKRWYRATNDSHLRASACGDLYMHVTVDRAELLTRFQPQSSQVAGNSAQTDNGPIVWEDFGSESLPELQRLGELASRDEWWTWPEAIAWIGSRDPKNIATLRYWGRVGGDRDPTIILGAQAFMATQFCEPGREAEADLLNAIQCGQVGTSGRLSKGAVATDLEPSIWRGGAVVWHDGETVLVDAKQKLAAWAFDVAIRRNDLVATFQPDDEESKAVSIAPVSPTRRGRTKGTGFQQADAPLLDEMRNAIEADPALNATSAAKLFADQAKGASFEAKVDRLSRAYRAGRNGE